MSRLIRFAILIVLLAFISVSVITCLVLYTGSYSPITLWLNSKSYENSASHSRCGLIDSNVLVCTENKTTEDQIFINQASFQSNLTSLKTNLLDGQIKKVFIIYTPDSQDDYKIIYPDSDQSMSASIVRIDENLEILVNINLAETDRTHLSRILSMLVLRSLYGYFHGEFTSEQIDFDIEPITKQLFSLDRNDLPLIIN